MSLKRTFIDLLEKQQMRGYDKSMQSQIITYCKANGINPEKKQEGEKEYFAFWHKVSNRIEPYSYRFYSRFMGTVPYIMSPAIANYFVERYLNPRRYELYYSDKLGYPQNYGPEHFPKTLIARNNGSVLLDGNNNTFSLSSKEIITLSAKEIAEELKHYDKVCLKPAVDTNGGSGVVIFHKSDTNEFVNNNGIRLDGHLLSSYGQSFLIQETIKQHSFFAQFNDSSVNTLRICTYRSVISEDIKVTAAVLRIGASGNDTDNFHANGRAIGIDLQTGQLQKTTLGSDGTKHDIWNGIDFSKKDFVVPKWNEIIRLACEMASMNRHMRLLAMDICMDLEGTIKFIEINHWGFSLRIPYYFGNDPLAGEAKEIIQYCLQERAARQKHLKVIDL